MLCRYYDVCIFNTVLWPIPSQIPHLVRTFARKRFDCKHSCRKRKVKALSVSCLVRREHTVRRWHKTSLQSDSCGALVSVSSTSLTILTCLGLRE